MPSDRLRAHYEQKYAAEAGTGDVEVISPVDNPETRFEAVVSAFPRLFDRGSVLEIGAGAGTIATSLLSNGIAADPYVATEYSAPRIERLRAVLAPWGDRAEVAHLDLDNPTPMPSEPYAAVLMLALIEHLVDPMGAMRWVHSVLRPGGFVWIDTPNIAKYTRRLKLMAGRFPSTASLDEGLHTYSGEEADLLDEGHLHYFTYRSLERMLVDRCGFSRTVRVPYSAGHRVSRRLEGGLARRWPTLMADVSLVAYR